MCATSIYNVAITYMCLIVIHYAVHGLISVITKHTNDYNYYIMIIVVILT